MSFQDWEITFEERTEELVEDYGDSWRLKFDDNIEPDNPAQDWFQYIRGAFARFKCSACNRTWGSGRVLVVFEFHYQRGAKRGTVKARHFRQECKTCEETEMEEPQFDSENIGVMLEKLVEKIRIRCTRKKQATANGFDLSTGLRGRTSLLTVRPVRKVSAERRIKTVMLSEPSRVTSRVDIHKYYTLL
ncbi:receptor-transporting protein 3-like isoform X1 [Alosa sapidissima]|uniref:receptor-transporting protein 3-like isoform X1 n=1 Tax=Alosa sapidissima TaxID=34773 RepID=UPI001C09FC99|nr:receptor-transporting protein 3-like isoform X1 [Alosa sapidissima]